MWWTLPPPGQGGKLRLTSRPWKHYHEQNRKASRGPEHSPVRPQPEGHSASGLCSNMNQSLPRCFSPLELRFQCHTQKPGCQPGSLAERVTPLMGSRWLLGGLRRIWGALLLSEERETTSTDQVRGFVRALCKRGPEAGAVLPTHSTLVSGPGSPGRPGRCSSRSARIPPQPSPSPTP